MNTFLDPCLCPMNGGVPKDMILRKIWWFLQMFSCSTDININVYQPFETCLIILIISLFFFFLYFKSWNKLTLV